MKRLLLVLLLLLSLAICVTACQKDKSNDLGEPIGTVLGESEIDTTVSTEDSVIEDASTENIVEETSVETQEELSEETTEEVTTAAPKYNFIMWNRKKDVVVHLSFDQLFEGLQSGGINTFAPGNASTWNGVVDLSTSSTKLLTFYGWVSVKGELGMFGYSIDSGKPIFSEDWAVEDASLTPHYTATRGDTGSRMRIVIDLSELKGTHTVTALYRSGSGKIVALYTFEVIIADLEPVELPVITPTLTPTLPDAYGESIADGTYLGDDDYVL